MQEAENITSIVRIKIVLIAGSLNRPSRSRANVDLMQTTLAALGVDATIWDLAERPLPFHDPRYHKDAYSNPSPEVRQLTTLCDGADGFVLATPVQQNSFSGVIKNALDNLTVAQFKNKPVALLSNAGGQGGVQACDQLRIVVRGLHGLAIPSQVVTTDRDFETWEGGYRLVNEKIHERFVTVAQEILMYAGALRTVRNTHKTI